MTFIVSYVKVLNKLRYLGGKHEKIVDIISEDVKQAFKLKGYEEIYGIVTQSNRPDLCQYQCNGAMAAARAYKKLQLQLHRSCRTVKG